MGISEVSRRSFSRSAWATPIIAAAALAPLAAASQEYGLAINSAWQAPNPPRSGYVMVRANVTLPAGGPAEGVLVSVVATPGGLTGAGTTNSAGFVQVTIDSPEIITWVQVTAGTTTRGHRPWV